MMMNLGRGKSRYFQLIDWDTCLWHTHCAPTLLPFTAKGGGSRTPATDVVCPMYARLPQLRDLAGLVDRGEETRPIMLCEYAHSMGNSTGGVPLIGYYSLIPGFLHLLEVSSLTLLSPFLHSTYIPSYLMSAPLPTGNLAEYWRLFKSHPSLIGGFVWDWVDQSLVATTTNGQPEGTSVRLCLTTSLQFIKR